MPPLDVVTFVQPKDRLDCINNYGSRPWRTRAGLPEPVVECPQFADAFFQPVQGRVLFFCSSGSQGVSEATQAGCMMNKWRKNIVIVVAVWYSTIIPA